MSEEGRRLLEAATRALARGELEQAHQALCALEAREPNPEWARRIAAIEKRRGRTDAELAALLRAARGYARRGEVLKAMACSKQILGLAPGHEETLERLRALQDAREGEPVEVGPPPTLPPVSRAAQPLSQLPLAQVMPGAAAHPGGSGGVYRIPLHDEAAAPLVLGQELAPARMVAPAAVEPEDLAIAAVEREVREAERVSDKLSPLFASLSKKSFGELLFHARAVDLPARSTLFRQGDPPDALYVVAAGTVGVIDEGPPRRGLAQLSEGSVFGEMALLDDRPRSATITALTDAQLIALDRGVVERLLESDPGFLTILLRFQRDRMVARLFDAHPLFSVLSARDQAALSARFHFLEVEPQAVLVREGERAPALFVLLSGRAVAVRRTEDGAQVELGRLGPGEVVGEISLLSDRPSIASVRAVTKCLALELPRAAFLRIVESRPDAMSFVRGLIAERLAQAQRILSSGGGYREVHVEV